MSMAHRRRTIEVMKRLLILLVALASALALGQTLDKTKHVGYLVWSSEGPRGHLEQALLDAMRADGYVEGKNLVIERRYIEGNADDLRAAASELAAMKLNLIVSTCSDSTRAAKQATAASPVPIVMAYVSDPVGQGLIASYSRPGGNITGLASQAEDTLPKMLQYLTEVVPPGTRVAVLYHTIAPSHPLLWRRLEAVARERGISVSRVDIVTRADLPAAFNTIARDGYGALLVLPDDNMTFNARAELIELVKRQRIPAIFGLREFVDSGGLMSYGPSIASGYRKAAVYVDKVLAGARPAELPVEQPTKFELVVNTGAARALGITISQDLLLRADDIVRDAKGGAPTNEALGTKGKREGRTQTPSYGM
jgi:putative tryptophan/tyrosine transport system substrate-binding protein